MEKGTISLRSGVPRAVGVIEQHSVDFIPQNERHGRVWKQGPFWFLANFSFFSVALGFIGPRLGLSLAWTVVAGVVGTLAGGLSAAFHASQGPRLGLPQMVQSRAQFGYRGVLVPVVASLLNSLVSTILQVNVLETGIHGIFGWNSVGVVIVVSVVAALLAIFGHDSLHLVFRLLFWCSIPFYLVLSIGMMTGYAGGDAPAAPAGFHAPAFMAVFAVAASYQIGAAPVVSDYTRYLPTRTKASHVVLAVLAGSSASLIWLIAMGAWLASRAGATDALVAMDTFGNHVINPLGTALAILSALGLVATIGLNTYSAGLAVATGIDSFRPVTPTRRLRAIATFVLLVGWVLVNLNLGDNQSTLISDLLTILLYLLVPWTAVNLIDFFFVRKGHYAIIDIFERNGIYGQWAWRGLLAYFLGLIAEVPFMVLSFYTGPLAKHIDGIDISFVVGLVVASVVYLLVSRSLNLQDEEGAVALSESVLQQGVEPEDP